MSITPAVELRFHPTDLDHAALREAIRPLGSPSQAIEAALVMARLSVITAAKAEVAQLTGEMSSAKLIGAADLAWQLYMPKFVRALGPVFAAQYYETMKAAGAGEIPMATVYALAEQHASRVGTYYHESSRDALVSGFNTFVNRRMTERVAADRVLDGYGLTARGMSGYTTRALDKAATSTPLKLKQRALDYIGTSVRRRSKLFATQEEHNISMQAQQVAWMWLQDKGQLSPAAEKVWLTARDERTCKVCAPMHNVRVLLSERFTLPNGTKIYVPGVHPNCRCETRLLDHPWKAETSKSFSTARLISKADPWDPKEHPRGGDPENPGRFSAKARSAPRPKPVAEREDTGLQEFLDTAAKEAQRQAHAEALEAFLDPPLEPKTKIGVTEPRIRIGTEQKIKVGTEAKTQIGAGTTVPKIGIKPTERTKVGLRPEQKTLVSADTQKMFVAYDERAKRVPRAPEPNKRLKKKTVLTKDSDGNLQPVYYIAGPWEEIDQNGNIELHDEMEFMTNGEQAAYMAGQEFDQNINDTAERIIDNAENKITQTFGDGRKFEATVEEGDVYEITGWAAYQNVADVDWQGDQIAHVTWKEVDAADNVVEGGDEYVDDVRYSEIAEEWHLEPSFFEMKVLVLTEGHESERGQTWQANFKDKNGYDSWIATGQYHTKESNRVQVGAAIPVKFVELEPQDPVYEEVDEPGVGWRE
jgi:hypothetical protein